METVVVEEAKTFFTGRQKLSLVVLGLSAALVFVTRRPQDTLDGIIARVGAVRRLIMDALDA